MKRTRAAEKLEIIRMVEESGLPIKQTLAEVGIARSTFYRWYERYQAEGLDGLVDNKPQPRHCWNRIPATVRDQVVETALEYPEKSPRELACHFTDTRQYFISEPSVYRILKAHDLVTSPAFILVTADSKFKHPTKRVNEMWQTDFTQFKVIGWGWYYLSTVLDDFSRYIIAYKLTTGMAATDVQDTLDIAVAKTGVTQVRVEHRPRLLSDNGPAYVSGELANYLKQLNFRHIRGKPYHPMTQGKIERYHRSLKNVICLENHYFPWELEQAIQEFIDYYNNQRYHEALNNVTPSDVFFGRAKTILSQREQIKHATLIQRRTQHLLATSSA
jgi:putative transposase